MNNYVVVQFYSLDGRLMLFHFKFNDFSFAETNPNFSKASPDFTSHKLAGLSEKCHQIVNSFIYFEI
jgi:hypothetical protein